MMFQSSKWPKLKSFWCLYVAFSPVDQIGLFFYVFCALFNVSFCSFWMIFFNLSHCWLFVLLGFGNPGISLYTQGGGGGRGVRSLVENPIHSLSPSLTHHKLNIFQNNMIYQKNNLYYFYFLKLESNKQQ